MPLSPLNHSDLMHGVYQRFCQVVASQSGNIAIIDAQTRMDYRTLLNEVNRLAALIAKSVPSGEPVAILLPNDYRYPAAMLAALACGCPYVPLDRNFPKQRIQRIIEKSGAHGVIMDSSEQEELKDLALDNGINIIWAHHFPNGEKVDWPSSGAVPGGPHSAAYIIYTSGSSGTPKGVWQNQQGLIHDVMQYVEAINITPSDRLSQLYSPSVNGAIRDIYGALLSGAVLCLSDLRQQRLSRIISDLNLRGVTIFHAMPPVLRLLVRATKNATLCPNARIAYVAGDRFFNQDLIEARQALPADCRFYTGIGSTECATLYRHWIIPPDWQGEGDLVPVGYAIKDRHMRLVGADGSAVEPGEVGEIVVISPFISQGYWQDKALTIQSFHRDRRGQRSYRTGDLGRLRQDGLLDFIGRSDRQIKIRGYRVEPAEIEAVIRQYAPVAEVVVMADESQGSTELIAFLEWKTERKVDGRAEGKSEGKAEAEAGKNIPQDTDQLAATIADKLPGYMQPKQIVALPSLPRLGNFKLDLNQLKTHLFKDTHKPSGLTLADEKKTVPIKAQNSAQSSVHNSAQKNARTDVQLQSTTKSSTKVSIKIWEKIAKRQLDPNQTLQQLGLDSIELLEIELELERASGYPVRNLMHLMATPESIHADLQRMFNPLESHQTVKKGSLLGDIPHRLSLLMAQASGEKLGDEGLIYQQNTQGTKPPLIWCFNHAREFNALAQALGPDQSLYGMRSFSGLLDPYADISRFEIQLADLYAETLLDAALADSVAIGGNCQSGRVAMRMANTLAQARKRINVLFLMENMVPQVYAEKLVVLYGDKSTTHNLRFHFRQPTANWSAFYRNYSVHEIQGKHGAFFLPDNIGVFAKVLKQQMEEGENQHITVLNPRARKAEIICQPAKIANHLQIRIKNTSGVDWRFGDKIELLITLHQLATGETQRPLRIPDAEMTLSVPLAQEETWVGEIALPESLSSQSSYWIAGLCMEGVAWFTETPGSQIMTEVRATTDE